MSPLGGRRHKPRDCLTRWPNEHCSLRYVGQLVSDGTASSRPTRLSYRQSNAFGHRIEPYVVGIDRTAFCQSYVRSLCVTRTHRSRRSFPLRLVAHCMHGHHWESVVHVQLFSVIRRTTEMSLLTNGLVDRKVVTHVDARGRKMWCPLFFCALGLTCCFRNSN